jgi:diguanylate cyclase (GGDEF)-like protein
MIPMTSRDAIARTVFIELVRLLYTARWPFVIVGVSLLTTGIAIYYQTGDFVILVIGFVGLALTISRLMVCAGFERAVRHHALDLAEARRWERRFAAGVVAMGACVGLFATRCFLLPDLTAHMIANGLVFGYAAGSVTRYSFRPWMVKLGLAAAVIPAAISSLLVFDLMHGVQAFLFMLFYLGSLETVGHLHATAVGQLTLRAEAAHLARIDILTGLPNRLKLTEFFAQVETDLGRNKRKFAVLSIDLDFFKEANDRFGHAAGDQILRIVAERLTELLGDGDLAARIGGDEFVVIQGDVGDASEADQLGRRIVAALSAPYAIDGDAVTLGASFGRALAPTDGITLDRLLRKADASLYAVKRNRPTRPRELTACVDDVPLAPDLVTDKLGRDAGGARRLVSKAG